MVTLVASDQLTAEERRVLDRLWQRLQNSRTAPVHEGGLDVLGRYYDADRYMRSIGLNVPPGYESLQTVIAWPAQACDTIEERLDIEGFRASATDAPSSDLWDLWQANGLDEGSQMAHLDALNYARSYAVVGADVFGDPVITVESPLWMTHERSAATRQVTAAARFVQAAEEVDLPQYRQAGRVAAATLFLPGMTIQLIREPDGGAWVVLDRSAHDMPLIPVVPLVNRPRISDRSGRSEMLRVIPVADACCRALTNLQIATEFQAVPQRYVLGATREDFQDAAGNQIPAWEAYLGKVWALANDQAKAGQFPAAELRNFDVAITVYGKIAASLQGVPLSYFAARGQPHLRGQHPGRGGPAGEELRTPDARVLRRVGAGHAPGPVDHLPRPTPLRAGAPGHRVARPVHPDHGGQGRLRVQDGRHQGVPVHVRARGARAVGRRAGPDHRAVAGTGPLCPPGRVPGPRHPAARTGARADCRRGGRRWRLTGSARW
ncbi:hypothetical protein ACFQ0T_29920 [Kitasatospora gansuensis]